MIVLKRPEKHAGIPEKIAALQKNFGHLQIRFLGKGFHPPDALVQLNAGFIAVDLNITVPCFRPVGLNTKGKQTIIGSHKIKTLIHHIQKILFL